ncbi:unnamed protein product, partial [Symbiodinium sp. CCMP2456]
MPRAALELPSTAGHESSGTKPLPGTGVSASEAGVGSSLGWFLDGVASDAQSRGPRGGIPVAGSPVSVAALHPPVEAEHHVGGSGLVVDAPRVGLVMVDGMWREYQLVGGHMVVQPLPGRNSTVFSSGPDASTTISGMSGSPVPYPPPPPPNPPATPKAAGVNWSANLTPGGTPVPPPPPGTPSTTSTTVTGAVSGCDVEEPSKLVTKLPALPSAKGGDAAVVAGDWLAQLEPSMSSLSPTAALWWTALMERVKDLYTLWLESAPVTRLTIRQQVLSRRPPPDRHHRVEQRAAMLLLDALPEELRHEAVSARAVTAEAMVFMVHCGYQPGGTGEKAHLLQFLTGPETGNGLDNTLNLARKWIRLATAVDIEDYAYLILGELEAAQLAQPLHSQPPKVARLDDHGAAAAEVPDKGKGKGKGKKPCWGWQDGSGCRYGSNCMFLHAPLGPGRCWECGADSHLKPQCPLLVSGQGGKASGGGAGGKGGGGAAQAGSGSGGSGGAAQNSSSAATSGTTNNAEEKPPRKPRRKGGGKDRGQKDAVRKTEEEPSLEPPGVSTSQATGEDTAARTEFFEEATKALKSLRLAKLTVRSLQSSSGSGGRALIDSGATTSMRTAESGETNGLPLRTVLLAEGETTFYQLPGGTLLTTKETAPIVAMNDLMEIGCRVSWCSAEGCVVVHPVKGNLGVRIVHGCPEVDEAVGLDLITEAAVKDLYNGVGLSWAWLHQAFPEAPSWLVSAIPVVANTDGNHVPWNRHERKKWKKASAIGVHLFCGKDRATWKSRAEVAHVVTVDQAEDVMADATYSALLDLALSGKVKDLAPFEIVMEMDGGDVKVCAIGRCGGCARELRKVRGPSSVPEDERDHDGDGFRSATWAAWAPGLKQVIKRAVEESLAGSTLEKIMKLDQTFLDHLKRDHTPFRRDCKACLAGSFRGHAHRRIVAPEAWCLSLDVIGPTRPGVDEYVKKIRYALIGTLVVPDMLGKLLQPHEPEGEDDGGGVGLLDVDDPVCEGDGEDEVEPPHAAEEERNKRELEKWKARVEKDKLDAVSCVEVPFVVTMGSKSSAEVLAATKDILMQVKKLGLAVQRIHSDRGREFICKGFRALCRDRGIVRTTTTGDDYKANGRVEALVGRAKNAVRTYLSSSGMGLEMWGFAMRHYVSRIQYDVVTQLGGRLPRLPPFGTKVFVKQRSWKLKKEFLEKVVAATVLCPSMDVARGFLVKTEEGSYLTTMVAVENVKEVSGNFEVPGPAVHADEPGVRRRMRGKTAIAMAEQERLEKLAVEGDDEHLLQDEELAGVFLDAGDYSMEAVESLLEGLWLGEQVIPNRRSK